MKKQRRHRDNRRRKKTVAQRKAAAARSVAGNLVLGPEFDPEFRQWGDERKFLLTAMLPVEAAIVQILTPHLAILGGDDEPIDEPLAELAVDLIYDNEDERDSVAAAIRDVYRDGAEAALPHLERAIQWRLAFEARRVA